MTSLLLPGISECLRQALTEDIGSGDVTTETIVPAGATLRGQIVAKQDGIVAGLDVAQHLLRQSVRAPLSTQTPCWQMFRDPLGRY